MSGGEAARGTGHTSWRLIIFKCRCGGAQVTGYSFTRAGLRHIASAITHTMWQKNAQMIHSRHNFAEST